MIIRKIPLFLILILGISNSAIARPYLGASGGVSAADASGFNPGFTQKAFAGLRNQDSGLEIAFVNFGDLKSKDGSGTVKASGVALSIMPYFPLHRKFEFFAKFGGFAWNASAPQGNLTFINSDGFSYILGFGANINFVRHFTMRIEFQKFYQIGATSSGAGGSAISALTTGLVWVF